MSTMKQIGVVGLFVAAVVFAGTPATAVPKYFASGTFLNVGDEPHAAGTWNISWPSSVNLTVSCRGLTPGATYYVYLNGSTLFGGFVAGDTGKGGLSRPLYPNPFPVLIEIYRVDATGLVEVLEST